jgi:integrase
MARLAFTHARVSGFKCPDGTAQAFLWDATTPGLGVRATPAGKPAYIFQGRYQNKTIRITIGSPQAWSIKNAQEKARELQRQIDEGRDPREVRAASAAANAAKRVAMKQDAVTVDSAWTEYLAQRRPQWGERHYQDHVAMSKAGGRPARRGTRGRGVTVAGPIYPLLAKRLVDLTPEAVEAWATAQAKTRPTYGRLAWRCLKAFLTWCSEELVYKNLVQVNVAKTRKTREAFGKQAVKTDVLQRSQLGAWFAAVQGLDNTLIAVYLQVLLLLGARPGEVLAMRWEDVDTKWKSLTLRDKVEEGRTVPLTPYVSHLLAALPRGRDVAGKLLPWVFSSPKAAGGVLTVPRKQHNVACAAAGIEGLTLHGLRRSFKSLTEWLEVPVGVVAQIMGHKPSATAEKHYTVRPLDLLRVHHEPIEAWILKQANVQFLANAIPSKLRAVK